MNTLSKFLLAPALLPLFCSCDDEATIDKTPVAVSFATTQLAIAESGGIKVISLPVSKTSKLNSEVIIEVSSLSDGFALEPAAVDGLLTLTLSPDKEAATFTIMPEDNSVINEGGDKIVTFTVTSVSEGLEIGENKSLQITITDDEIPATATFAANTNSIRENVVDGMPVVIGLSHAAPGTGTLTLALELNDLAYGTDFTTLPEAVNGKITLPVETGVNQVSFALLPMNDNLFNGSRSITVNLEKAEGAVSRGLNTSHDFTITDDELATKGKGYTLGSGLWTYKKEYSYNLDGTLAKVEWQQATPGASSGEITYEYDENGKLLKSIDNPVQETVYTWEGNRIVKSERIKNGVLMEYKLFGYDDAGNVGEVTEYNKQPDGSFVMSFVFVYLYHTDGNIYKQLTYSELPDAEDVEPISIRTYEHYSTIENPFTMVDILPNKKTQLTLPQTYRLEENGFEFNYEFSYEFDSYGRPTKRTASTGTTSEVANYHYFD